MLNDLAELGALAALPLQILWLKPPGTAVPFSHMKNCRNRSRLTVPETIHYAIEAHRRRQMTVCQLCGAARHLVVPCGRELM